LNVRNLELLRIRTACLHDWLVGYVSYCMCWRLSWQCCWMPVIFLACLCFAAD